MARALIAGFGYLGSYLARELVRTGHDVFGLSRNPRAVAGVTAVEADLTELDSLRALPEEIDYVFYMASADGRDDERYRDAYVAGPRNLLEALAGTRTALERFLFVSSTGVYEQTDGSWVDESSPTGESGFPARRLLEGEEVVKAASAVVLRLAGIYGPERAYWLSRVRGHQGPFEIGVDEVANLIHVEDAARALVHLMSRGPSDSVYLGVDSEPVEKREMVRWLCRELSLDPPRFTSATSRERVRANKRCSNEKLIETGFELRYPTFREGFRSLIEKSRC